jgi:hypothetical protein
MNQAELFEPFEYVQPDFHGKGLSKLERFELYHELNPKVYSALRGMALDLSRRGRKKFAICMLTENLRWNYMMRTDDPSSSFKFCDHYKPYYARMLMDNEPELDGVFNLKILRSK